MKADIDQQIHGYRNGHQLLSAGIKLDREDQDVVDRLSDMAGQLRPGETFKSYLTAYPLPSGKKFVLARTWQDIAARRAGCVLTRSLFVDMTEWSDAKDIQKWLERLVPLRESEEGDRGLHWAAGAALAPLEDRKAPEIVDALFLERNPSVVVFGFDQAELTLVRILTALWPSARSRFAASSFALAPRRIAEREFDLLFAPTSARARFADWPGRQIDRGGEASHHRWSASIADAVLRDPTPSLLASDPLGALADDAEGDEGALRLSLMWNELNEKSEKSPIAVLGMLDILQARGGAAAHLYPFIASLAARAASLALAQFDAAALWRFLAALALKWPRQRGTLNFYRTLRQTARQATIDEPHAAAAFLTEERTAGRPVPRPIIAGIASGLVDGGSLRLPLDEVTPAEPVRLMLSSRNFAVGFVAACVDHPADRAIEAVEKEIGEADARERARLRLRLLPQFNDALFAPLLPPLLADASEQQLGEAARIIAETTGMRIPAFDRPLIAAAEDWHSLRRVQEVVAARAAGSEGDRFLLKTLDLDSPDILWLAGDRIDRERGSRILATMMREKSDRQVQAAQRDPKVRATMLALLMAAPETNATEAARLLRLGEFAIDDQLEAGLALIGHLQGEERNLLLAYLLENGLRAAKTGDRRVSRIFELGAKDINGPTLIRWIAAPRAASGRVAHNLLIINRAPAPTRNKILARIDELSRALILRGNENLGEPSYQAWADLIADSGKIDRAEQLAAATRALAFALAHVRWPMGSLVVASFRHVYAQLPRGPENEYGFLSSIFAPMSYLFEWDRAKEARSDLVDAFLKSVWAPGDLVLAAKGTGDEMQILHKLLKARGGGRYLSAIRKDAETRDKQTRDDILAIVRRFEGSKSSKR